MIQKIRPLTLHAPGAAAGRLSGNGSSIDVSTAQNIIIVAEINKGDAAAITLAPQGDDAADTGFAAITNNAKIFAAVDTGTSDTLVRQTDAVSFVSGAVATTHRVVMQIDPASLGNLAASGDPITQLRVVVSGGHADDRGSITAYIEPRYKP